MGQRLIRLCLMAVLFAFLPCEAKIIARRDPLDGAIDATLIAIVKQQSPDTFRIEETFLGAASVGDILLLPGFRLAVEDTSVFITGIERIEPIYSTTRILLFLKPAKSGTQPWEIAGFGNCYFWSHDPNHLDDLRAMAMSAVDLRTAWEAVHSLPDERQRVEALWPWLWNRSLSAQQATRSALKEIGPVAGDYVAEQLDSMTSQQKMSLLSGAYEFRSELLHRALIRELKAQEDAWQTLLARRRQITTYDKVSPPGRAHYSSRRPQDGDADHADDIYGVLYYGFTGLAGFHDRDDLPFIREAALWGVKYRFKQLDDAALEAFRSMPDRANLPIIESIWNEFSRKPMQGNELLPYDVIQTLNEHRFPDTIPLMAPFARAGFGHEMAQQFLIDMTGADFGNNTKGWLEWYDSHK